MLGKFFDKNGPFLSESRLFTTSVSRNDGFTFLLQQINSDGKLKNFMPDPGRDTARTIKHTINMAQPSNWQKIYYVVVSVLVIKTVSY